MRPTIWYIREFLKLAIIAGLIWGLAIILGVL